MSQSFSISHNVQEQDDRGNLIAIPDSVWKQLAIYLEKITYEEFIEIGKLYEKCFIKPRVRKLKNPEIDCKYISEKMVHMNMVDIARSCGLSRATLYKRLNENYCSSEKEKSL